MTDETNSEMTVEIKVETGELKTEPGLPELKLSEIYSFRDPKWLEVAMTHKSFANERRATEPSVCLLYTSRCV